MTTFSAAQLQQFERYLWKEERAAATSDIGAENCFS